MAYDFLPPFLPHSLSLSQCGTTFSGFTFYLGESALRLTPHSPYSPEDLAVLPGSQPPVLSGEAPSLLPAVLLGNLCALLAYGGVHQAFLLVPFPAVHSGFGLYSSVSYLG